MKTKAGTPLTHCGKQGECGVVIAYEDFSTGLWAKKAFDLLVDKSPPGRAFNSTMWKFDFLRAPKLREIAAQEASRADIVILAAHREGDLPLPVKDWIDLWLTSRRKTTLVVMLDTQGREPRAESAWARSLQRMASHYGLTYLCLELDYHRDSGPGSGETTPMDEKGIPFGVPLQN